MGNSKKAAFLDRDGVIIEETNFITDPNKVKLLENAAKAISRLNKEYLVVIITNQPAVGRGMCTEDQAKAVNNRILELLKEKGATIDATYMCFHHPIQGFGKYKTECECRKPKPGMILKAAEEHNINLKQSFTIGDKTGDIKAGYLAGTRTILVSTGYGGDDGFKDATPDYTAKDLYGAAEIMLKDTSILKLPTLNTGDNKTCVLSLPSLSSGDKK
ncbi:MAG: HAD family hydrolase [Nanoarchaeota archaeon]|nr:HAD family hydrolase [Nanoarchaeota archaeon]